VTAGRLAVRFGARLAGSQLPDAVLKLGVGLAPGEFNAMALRGHQLPTLFLKGVCELLDAVDAIDCVRGHFACGWRGCA
jgi:hypothetical protein